MIIGIDTSCYTTSLAVFDLAGRLLCEKRRLLPVAEGECDRGILICGTGVGISISANKVHGIRAAVCSEPVTAALTKRHNNANIIAFGARIVGIETAKAIVDAWLDAEFEGGRHAHRVGLMMDIENKE